MFGIDIVKSKETKEQDPDAAERIYYRCLEGGLSFKISGGSVLTLSPPLNIASSDFKKALDIVEGAIKSEAG